MCPYSQVNICDLYYWQQLIAALLAAVIPFIFYLFAKWFEEREKVKNYLVELERVLVEQLNMSGEIKYTLERFIEKKVDELISSLEASPKVSHNLEASLPLFSTRTISSDFLKLKTKSGYLDTRLDKLYALSSDLPHIVHDIRNQFETTLRQHNELTMTGKNTPEVQARQSVANLKRYKEFVNNEMIYSNLALYIKKASILLVAIRTHRKYGPLLWRISNEWATSFKFFFTRDQYIASISERLNKLDIEFEAEAKSIVEKIW